MKKLLLLTLLGFSLSLSTLALAAPKAHPLINEAEVRLDDLSAKSVFRGLYTNRMTTGFFATEEEDLKGLPYVAITSTVEGVQQVAVLHPTLTYTNHEGEKRFLIISEILTLNEDSHEIETCHVCTAAAELYVFKQTNQGFQLLSSSQKKAEFGGSWGRSALVRAGHLEIQKIGHHRFGFFSEHGYMGQGFLSAYLDLISLNEDKPIERHPIATTVEDNTGAHDEDSPLAYAYESTYELIDDGTDYFPIKIVQTGEAPNPKNRIVKINHTQMYHYNKAKNKYLAR